MRAYNKVQTYHSASKQLEATDEVVINFLNQLDVAGLTLHLKSGSEARSHD